MLSWHRYVDDLTFTLTESGSGGCQVEAFSTSRLWFVNDAFDFNGDDLYIIGAVRLSVCHKSDYFRLTIYLGPAGRRPARA